MVNIMKKGLLLLLASVSVNADSIPSVSITDRNDVVVNIPIAQNFNEYVHGSITLHKDGRYTVDAQKFICTGNQFSPFMMTDEWKRACNK